MAAEGAILLVEKNQDDAFDLLFTQHLGDDENEKSAPKAPAQEKIDEGVSSRCE